MINLLYLRIPHSFPPTFWCGAPTPFLNPRLVAFSFFLSFFARVCDASGSGPYGPPCAHLAVPWRSPCCHLAGTLRAPGARLAVTLRAPCGRLALALRSDASAESDASAVSAVSAESAESAVSAASAASAESDATAGYPPTCARLRSACARLATRALGSCLEAA